MSLTEDDKEWLNKEMTNTALGVLAFYTILILIIITFAFYVRWLVIK